VCPSHIVSGTDKDDIEGAMLPTSNKVSVGGKYKVLMSKPLSRTFSDKLQLALSHTDCSFITVDHLINSIVKERETMNVNTPFVFTQFTYFVSIFNCPTAIGSCPFQTSSQ
jgi:hypothetical protein